MKAKAKLAVMYMRKLQIQKLLRKDRFVKCKNPIQIVRKSLQITIT